MKLQIKFEDPLLVSRMVKFKNSIILVGARYLANKDPEEWVIH